ncbi:hypothetical protein [Rhizobium herbae]|uniref:WD40 repeat domain-containing protein n=1 Tax=Rhizobium herbae TaxID=508661 RepID=A0ABS4ELV3_9HYPH|nr:hypothetical protein [Rhizobium herbae]MBP1858926.1 hypothetical protein [Rhizobium herbae]
MTISDLAAISIVTQLPEPPGGWFDYSFTVLMDGNLAIVRTDIDVRTGYLRWWEQRSENPYAAAPELWNGRIRLSVFDGISESHIVEVDSRPHPVVSRLADGRWLLAQSRCERGEGNGHVYDADGLLSASFVFGDGIEHVQCSPDNTIWVGYFDEGVFADRLANGRWPVSSGGIVRFSADGVVLWSYNDEDHGSGPVDDCYALTLDGTIAWSCFYSDFPIAAIDGQTVNLWKNEISGVKAMAVDRDYILLAGGYRDDAQRIALVQLGNKESKLFGTLRAPAIHSDAVGLMQGLGQTLHIVADGCWTRLTVAAARAFLVKRQK